MDVDTPTQRAARLPTELCYYTIDYLRGDMVSIRHCCLVSKAWLEYALTLLYVTVQILDDSVSNFAYIREYAPFVTMRMQRFRQFLLSGSPYIRHIVWLRIANFWHNNDEWADYLADWVSMPIPEAMSGRISILQVYVSAEQNLGSLLQILALRFPNVTELSTVGRFADPGDLGVSFSSFSHMKHLLYNWTGPMNAALRAVLTTDTYKWTPAPPSLVGGAVIANCDSLPLLLAWNEKQHYIGKLSLYGIRPDQLRGGALQETLNACLDGAKQYITQVDINATEACLIPEDARIIRDVTQDLPQANELRISFAYNRETQAPTSYAARGRSAHAYDPLGVLAVIFMDPARVARRLPFTGFSSLVIQLQLPESDMDLLWYHDWATLDMRSLGRLKVGVSLCLTQCSELGGSEKQNAFRGLVRRALSWTLRNGGLFTAYREVYMRKVLPYGDEAEFVWLARNDFAGKGEFRHESPDVTIR
ncbi:hypothetical protein EXIGLDRAFT_749680 [Exidia glandulosa HHB12029]|uniref:F-box domain-containing protein n=1 Tax=Exidia glandulosa HHB12029 TaxID=1314781 RepID=A0A165HU22_EXIGL|nr:hypothetical protein EXIGLDRAFT_749680 [Exidia glandulosa HHB12029]